MTIERLLIVQSSYAQLAETALQLKALYQAQDYIIFIEDAVFLLNHCTPQDFAHVAVLQSDAHLLPQCWQNHVQLIDYDDWADYIAQTQHVITWK